jgi:predicted dehydrogenase
MDVIIIGAGRMGIRHAQGIANVESVNNIVMVDINQESLSNASSTLLQNPNYHKLHFYLKSNIDLVKEKFDIGILASTANNRVELYELLVVMGCKHILVEKPLGQSYQEVIDFNDIVVNSGVNCYVNLNMRLYSGFIKLRDDLDKLPQLKGHKTITVNTGTLGIGANGIHYLDLLYFLLDADDAKIIAAKVDDTIIPSGRGSNFCDFGGWSVIEFYKNNVIVGTAILSLSSISTVFGSWDIVAPHGRIYFNEVEQKRIDTFRKVDSEMPINRYHADYLPAIEAKIESPFLGDLTSKWLIALLKGDSLLPTIGESIKVHALMFDWLNHSKTHQEVFPIT